MKNQNLNSTTETRITKEAMACRKLKNNELVIEPCFDNNIYYWKAFMKPSSTSLYHGMVLELSIILSPTYPYAPPKITFVTPVYHPNINTNGNICISTLSKDWSPALTVEKTLLSIMSLLDAPEPSDPLWPEAAEVFLSDEKEYYEKVRETYDAYIQNLMNK